MEEEGDKKNKSGGSRWRSFTYAYLWTACPLA